MDGREDGAKLGERDGCELGSREGELEGTLLGLVDGIELGRELGTLEGDGLGAALSGLILIRILKMEKIKTNIQRNKHTNTQTHKEEKIK